MCNAILNSCLRLTVPILLCFSAIAEDLPPGVPNPLNPDGTYGDGITFTTKAYEREAFRLIVQEANWAARELALPETLPITASNVVGAFVSPFGDAYVNKRLGTVTTSNYFYGVTKGYRFSTLAITRMDERCAEYEENNRVPLEQIDTNGAIRDAETWLTEIGVDVKALNTECKRSFDLDHFWNRIAPGAKPMKKTIVPIFQVYWETPNKPKLFSGAASVRLFTPTKTLLQLNVYDAKYILRPPIIVTNLAVLLSQTNAPNRANAPSPPQNHEHQ